MANADLTISEFHDYYTPALITPRTKDSVTGADIEANETAMLDAAEEIVLGKLRRAYSTSVLAADLYPLAVRTTMYTFAFHMLARRTGSLNQEIVADFQAAAEQVERWASKVDLIPGLTPDVGLPKTSRTTSERKLSWDPTGTDSETRGTLDGVVTFPYTGSGKPT